MYVYVCIHAHVHIIYYITLHNITYHNITQHYITQIQYIHCSNPPGEISAQVLRKDVPEEEVDPRAAQQLTGALRGKRLGGYGRIVHQERWGFSMIFRDLP